MKKLILIAMALMVGSVQADELDQPMCKVRICNKIERFTLSIGSMISDEFENLLFQFLSRSTRYWKNSSIIINHVYMVLN